MAEKKIIYIVGCGRSGSTILGFALGNAVGAMDLGEVSAFIGLRGRPNGFAMSSENYAFWDAILRDVSGRLGEIDFSRLAAIQSAVDRPTSVVPLALFGHLYRRDDVSAYRRFLRVLYERIQMEPAFEVLIDSSKSPSYLWHLRRTVEDDRVHVIHLIRNPIEVARAMATPDQSAPKSSPRALLYFFAINTLSAIAARRLGERRFLRLYFEDLVSDPEKALTRIGRLFSIDPSPAIERIRRGQPLARGHVLNGNRMRMQERVLLRRSSGLSTARSVVERVVERVARLAFGAASGSGGE